MNFLPKSKMTNTTKFLNLANNNLKAFPKTLKGTQCSEVYLAGNPIDCNCDMLWFTNWLNATNVRRMVKDYKRVLCAGGKWNGTQVYKLSAVRMGCYPKNIGDVSSSVMIRVTFNFHTSNQNAQLKLF